MPESENTPVEPILTEDVLSTVSEKKTIKPVDLDDSADFETPISIEAIKLENAQKNADAQNKIASTRNNIAIMIVIIALFSLISLTINRDWEKDNYIKDLRNNQTLDFKERQALIKEANDEFHQSSTSTFYNILIGATAYLLGVSTSKK